MDSVFRKDFMSNIRRKPKWIVYPLFGIFTIGALLVYALFALNEALVKTERYYEENFW